MLQCWKVETGYTEGFLELLPSLSLIPALLCVQSSGDLENDDRLPAPPWSSLHGLRLSGCTKA